MKTRSILCGATSIAATTPLFAQTLPGMPAMPMAQNIPTMQKRETAQGAGVIKAINAAKSTLTIRTKRSRQSTGPR